MTVGGIDLSMTSTGLAFIQDSGITTKRIRSEPPRTDRNSRTGKPLPPTLLQRKGRLDDISRRILALVTPLRADLVAVEGPSLGQRRQSGEFDRAGLWWMVTSYLHTMGLIVVEISPASVKKYATGSGIASKDEVLAAVVRRYTDVEVAGNDQADALVLAAMAARHLGKPIEDSLPVKNLDAMQNIDWPELAYVPPVWS